MKKKAECLQNKTDAFLEVNDRLLKLLRSRVLRERAESLKTTAPSLLREEGLSYRF